MFCGSGRGKFTRSTEGFTEHPGEVEARGFHGARRKEWKTRRGGGSTEESWKHGGELEARGRVGSTEKGVENTEFLTEEYWKMHSFILYFYASMRRGRLMIIFFSC